MKTEDRYKLMLAVQRRYEEYMFLHPSMPRSTIAVAVSDEFGISCVTLYRYLKKKLIV